MKRRPILNNQAKITANTHRAQIKSRQERRVYFEFTLWLSVAFFKNLSQDAHAKCAYRSNFHGLKAHIPYNENVSRM